MKFVYDLAMYLTLALGASYGPWALFLIAMPIALALAVLGGFRG